MKYTVLVVEDERDQRRALIERVDWESAGFEVAGEAENGFEALELTETLEPYYYRYTDAHDDRT